MGGLGQWASLADFLSMRGHGLYVWGSYGVALLALAAEAWLARARHRGAVKRAAEGEEA